jgi:hypothetical protein
MTVEEQIRFNKSHALTKLSSIIEAAAAATGVGAIVATFYPLTLPYVGPVHPGFQGILVQLSFLALLCNTHNVYEYYICTLELDLVLRLFGLSLYALHFVTVFLGLLYPQYWLWGATAVLGLVFLINVLLWNKLRHSPEHPYYRTQTDWMKRAFGYLWKMGVYAAVAHILRYINTYQWLHHAVLDVPTANLLISDIEALITFYASYVIVLHALQRVRRAIDDSFASHEVGALHHALGIYYSRLSERAQARATLATPVDTEVKETADMLKESGVGQVPPTPSPNPKHFAASPDGGS